MPYCLKPCSITLTYDQTSFLNQVLAWIIFAAYVTANRDYMYPRGGMIQVVFRPGTPTTSFQLRINNDRISERTETLKVTIIEVSISRGVTTLGAFNSAEVDIIDDDRKIM